MTSPDPPIETPSDTGLGILDSEQILSCMRCGLCQAVCPTYQEAGIEPVSPRGRVALVRALAEGKLGVGKNFAQYLRSCLDCLACTTTCPSGVRIDDLVLSAKQRINEERKPSLLNRVILQSILPFPERLRLFSRPIALYQHLGLQPLMRWSKIMDMLSERLGNLEYLLPSLSPKPLRDQLEEVIPAKRKREHRVGFFLGCAQDLIFTSSSLATVAVLTENSCEVVIPSDLKCCGMPYRAYGEMEQARKLARHNIDVFSQAEVEAIVTDCATCGSFTKGYATLLRDDPEYAERALVFSNRIRDVSEFLAQTIAIRESLGEVKARVTYHEPCHLVRGQKVSHEPRHLLSLIPGLELVEMKEADWCCGGAGTYSLGHYDLSMKILERKMANIAATEADLIASGCPACRMQLRLGAKRKGLKARVVHPVDLLHQAYQAAGG